MSATPYEAASPTRHEKYYLTDDHLIFLVEDKLFRVHAHFLVTHSPIFADMLAFPAPTNTDPEGTSDKDPIVLENVKAIDFERLMWVFYNKHIGDFTADKDTWLSVLALAHKWEMDTIKTLAIKKLGSLALEPIEKILACERYDIERGWALEAFETVCKRENALTFDEGVQLGVKMCIAISGARERILKLGIKFAGTRRLLTGPTGNYYSTEPTHEEMMDIVCRMAISKAAIAQSYSTMV